MVGFIHKLAALLLKQVTRCFNPLHCCLWQAQSQYSTCPPREEGGASRWQMNVLEGGCCFDTPVGSWNRDRHPLAMSQNYNSHNSLPTRLPWPSKRWSPLNVQQRVGPK
ncbi:hypothetical protein XENTR_v10007750 [Xenopus tropicalis]|nr:hypothetical protein XENTR_v10007750 [Xenopus tropicalis]